MSFSDMAGTLTATPGRLMPLLFEMTPPSIDLGDDVGGRHLDRPEADLAVVDRAARRRRCTSPGMPL